MSEKVSVALAFALAISVGCNIWLYFCLDEINDHLNAIRRHIHKFGDLEAWYRPCRDAPRPPQPPSES